MGPRALALCLYSLDWAVAAAVAVATVADVAAVAMSMTNMPIARYHIENIFEENAFFFGNVPFKINNI